MDERQPSYVYAGLATSSEQHQVPKCESIYPKTAN